ncbi:DNA mismatch repair protein MutL [Alkalibacterium sp. AK22]|uniref:DNA mismatch repair endonuclease MutL n=1 Tax=Alkalibacterium sp. AK22 TaxID=1229520 RepID=UPI0004503055|nr:DNA mismatch repair endonuclease MutL [Alkalibacterium sp. AK22]EXJ22334.1 DNA mismatch repair protein MutL [Alkalibacterium sp. AK22]
MQTTIQIMSPTLANQIAAGEVIERPASVVKELVENAIDANSGRIEIFVEEAGLKSIHVIDDGDGIPKEEVPKAFERHATSKLLSNEDLFRIRTLGFRGEALPSIASVSEVTVETAQKNLPGRRLVLKGGELIEDRAASSRKGTRIAVEALFYNTPARLKYVKTLKTELSHITDGINRFALAHPDISFKLVSDGSTLIKTVGNRDQIQAIAGVYGVGTAKKMKAIRGESFDFELSGFVSLPEVTRASNTYITLILNGRVIKNYALTKAIVEGYGSTLMVGRYPVAVISIQVDPLLLDVNVHPTKQQVRISSEKELGQLLKDTIRKRLHEETRIPSAYENVIEKPKKRQKADEKPQQTTIFSQQPSSSDSPFLKNQGSSDSVEAKHSKDFASHSAEEGEKDQFQHNTQPNQYESNFSKLLEDRKDVSFETVNPASEQKVNEGDFESGFPDLDYIGQMHGTYLFAQNEKGLYIIDQHAAQERIKYEYFKEAITRQGTDLQELLVPVVLDYPLDEAVTIRDNQSKLEEASVFLEEFGQNSFLVRQHPNWIKAEEVEETIREMIAFFLRETSLSVGKFREETAIMMSCKGSIKANHYLSRQESEQLLHDLKQADNPYNCPHGRPVLVSFSTKDMEKMFKRIQDPH